VNYEDPEESCLDCGRSSRKCCDCERREVEAKLQSQIDVLRTRLDKLIIDLNNATRVLK